MSFHEGEIKQNKAACEERQLRSDGMSRCHAEINCSKMRTNLHCEPHAAPGIPPFPLGEIIREHSSASSTLSQLRDSLPFPLPVLALTLLSSVPSGLQRHRIHSGSGLWEALSITQSNSPAHGV